MESCLHGILFYLSKRNLYATFLIGFLKTFGFLVLTIFNKGAYLTFKPIFHKALNLF